MITRLRNYTFARRSRDKSSQRSAPPLPSLVSRTYDGFSFGVDAWLHQYTKVIGFNLIGAIQWIM